MSNPYLPMSRTKRFFKRIEKFFVTCKQKYIVAYLMRHGGGRETIAHYKREDTARNQAPITSSSPIWTCWWQGEKAMPDIAKACFNAMKIHAGNHPVRLVTQDNFRQYADLPDYIVEKVETGAIDFTHFSDILRMALLRQHGGIWMDSTLLLPHKDVDEFIPADTNFWSCHHRPIYYNISQGGWTSFFLACGKHNFLPSFIEEMHLRYWAKHNKLVDYLLLDYTFAIARKYVPAIHDMIERVELTEMGPLGKFLNEPYSEERWEEFCNRYNFHKVTYKIPLSKLTSDGEKTFYGHIIETFLPQATTK